MIAIITVNYNTDQMTIDCIKSLLESDYQDFKVFLIENGSKQTLYERLVQEFKSVQKVEIIRSDTNRGYVGGVNLGLETAREQNPSHYMIMNNDTIIDKRAISELINCADRYEGNAIISGKVYYYDRPDVLQHTGMIITDSKFFKGYFPGKNQKDVGQCDQETERDSLDDVFWLIPAKIVDDIGSYCNYYFMYAEQGDYAQKARRKGYKLIYTPGAKIWHKESMTAGGGNTKALTICYWRSKSFVIFSYRNLKRKYFILRIAIIFVRFIKDVVTRSGNEQRVAKARLRGLAAGIKWLFNKVADDGYNPYLKK